jgi:hydrogenase expression/formation protein HypC
MCLAFIGRIEEISGEMAVVEIMGVQRDISVVLVPEAKKGDYVMVHAGFAINTIDEKDAKETEALLKQVLGS